MYRVRDCMTSLPIYDLVPFPPRTGPSKHSMHPGNGTATTIMPFVTFRQRKTPDALFSETTKLFGSRDARVLTCQATVGGWEFDSAVGRTSARVSAPGFISEILSGRERSSGPRMSLRLRRTSQACYSVMMSTWRASTPCPSSARARRSTATAPRKPVSREPAAVPSAGSPVVVS